MKWSSLGTSIGKAAPMVGSLLGGKAGGIVGAIVAKKLGVDATPSSVAQALSANPRLIAKVREIELTHKQALTRLQLEAETAQLAEVNETMRAELQTDGFFKSGWRPFIGWIFGSSIAALIGSLIYAIIRNPNIVSNPDFTGLLVWLFTTMAALLGVNIRQRSKDKELNAGKEPNSGFLSSLTKRIRN